MKNIKYLSLFLCSAAFIACNDPEDVLEGTPIEPEATEVLPALTSGSANFSNYVAVGASFTAGFTDNALFQAGQNNSFPNILSQKFEMIGGGNFTQPLMDDNIGGLLFSGNVITNPRLFFNGVGPVGLPATPTTETTNVLSGPFTNMGVPGAKSFHFVAPGYGNLAGVPVAAANPYFARMASSAATTIIADAVAQSPTFFTLSEIGGNDVLAYAISGGSGVDQKGNLDPATYGNNDITDPNVFAATFSASVDALVANGAKGVVTNVPYITSLPHFTRVPHNPVPLDGPTASAVNSAYATYNGGIQAALNALAGTGLFTQEEADARKISFAASANNAVVIVDEDLTDLGAINPAFAALPKYRQATAEDLLVLPASNFIGSLAVPGNPSTANGIAVPLADKWVLTPQEQLSIKIATDAYNVTIESVATSKGLALVDFKDILMRASTTGIPSGNYILTTELVTGGLVSLDGIHLTSRGYAVLANEIMTTIDATYGTNFEASDNLVDAGSYPTNYAPTLQ